MYIWSIFLRVYYKSLYYNLLLSGFWIVGAERARFHVVMITLVKSSRLFFGDVRCRDDKNVRELMESFFLR